MKMKLEDVQEFLEFLNEDLNLGFSTIYIGYLEDKEENSIGVYEGNTGKNDTSLGGQINTKMKEYNTCILVHGTTKQRETQKKALDLFAALESYEFGFENDDFRVNRLTTIEDRPIDCGIDKKGICEYVINLKFLYYV